MTEGGAVDALLARLGLGDHEAGALDVLAAAEAEPVGFGLAATPVAALARDGVRDPLGLEPEPLDLAAASGSGLTVLRLLRRPAVIVVGGSPGAALRLRHDPAAAGAVARSAEGVFIDLALLSGPVAVLDEGSDRGLLVEGKGDGSAVVRSLAPAAAPGPPPPLAAEPWPDPAPIIQAVEECLAVSGELQGDRWLDEEVAERLRDGSLLDAFAGLGVLARLGHSRPSAAARRDALEAILRGAPPPDLDRERRVARRLPTPHLAAVEDLALAASARLVEHLEAIARAPAPDDVAWHALLEQTLVERDDLEGVVVLLAASGRGQRLERGLAQVDRLGREILGAVPASGRTPGPRVGERLRRAASASPEGWWTERSAWEAA